MKVGILTFHNAINYGAVLQCYALKELLTQYGHRVEVIDYRIPIVENRKKLLSTKIIRSRKGLTSKLRYIVKNLISYRKMRKSSRVFDEFLKVRLKLSPRVYSACDIPSYYDCIVFGSDQIWNPRLCGGFNPVFWGAFPKRNVKFVSFAASLGEPKELNEEHWNRIGCLINVFDKISVREKELKICLENRFHIEVKRCLDPTLLVNQNCFEEILYTPQDTDYVFLYNVQKDPYATKFARFIAEKLNCKVILGQAKPDVRKNIEVGCKLVEGFAPEMFLGYIKNARLVLANSFHAIAISLVFRKNFYSLDCARPGRVKDLLASLGLLDRHVSSRDLNIDINDVDYSLLSSKLQTLRAESLQFINEIEQL